MDETRKRKKIFRVIYIYIVNELVMDLCEFGMVGVEYLQRNMCAKYIRRRKYSHGVWMGEK